MRNLPDFEKLLEVIIAEGQGCECPHKGTCTRRDKAWCRYVGVKGSGTSSAAYHDLFIAPCVYRDKPGCCWVLSGVETFAANCLAGLGVHHPPVPSELITGFEEKRGISVRTLPLKGYHGAAWLLGKEWVVYLNAVDSPQVQRQTMFHEAFHIACRNSSPAFRRVDLKQKPFRDFLADHFATCILMNKQWVEEHWAVVRDVKKMADIFDVSISAMDHRLRQLGLLYGERLSLVGVH